MLLPLQLKPTPLVLNPSESVLFDKNLFTVRIVTFFSILITYGTVFTPLALVSSIGIYNYTLFEQALICKTLLDDVSSDDKHKDIYIHQEKFSNLNEDKNEESFVRKSTNKQIYKTLLSIFRKSKKISRREIINLDCDGILEFLPHLFPIVTPFVSIFYSYFVFDTMGGKVGWKKAIFPTVVTMLAPIFFWIFVKMRQNFLVIPVVENSPPLKTCDIEMRPSCKEYDDSIFILDKFSNPMTEINH
jgi:hypothetical protein